MNRVAIAFSTCDRVELSKQSIEPLLQPDKFDLHWVDGSKTDKGIVFPTRCRTYGDNTYHHGGVRGGSGAAIVFALSEMLAKKWEHPNKKATSQGYDYIGLVENDVLLDPDWFEPTFALFEQGKQDGLKVGAVSARCYEERILIQRPDYAICHNLGAGMIIFTREAAQSVLNQYRVQWTTENRQIFSQLIGVDIGPTWAFGGHEHFLVADWRWDALLASHGYASLALTPAKVQMIGQIPSLAEQNLTLAADPHDRFCDDVLFDRYCENLEGIREGKLKIASHGLFHRDVNGSRTVFAHQIAALGGTYSGTWKLKDAPGFGPFGWIADENSEISVPVYGHCDIFIGGGKEGGQVFVIDEQSGYTARPVVPPEGPQGQILAVTVPGACAYRTIRVERMTPGTVFYAVRCRDEQPVRTDFQFNYDVLPKP